MVDVAGSHTAAPAVASTAHAPLHTPFMATSALAVQNRFPITAWRPRSGLTLAYYQWRRDVGRLLAAFGLQPSALQESTPAIAIPAARSGTKLETARVDADVARQKADLAQWLRVNTALYWHILPSIEVDGAFYMQDSQDLDSLYSGQQANGRLLVKWALQFVDLTSMQAQQDLSAALSSVRIADGASRAHLAVHLQKILQVWRLLSTADERSRSSLVVLYNYVLQSLPTTFSGSTTMHLVSLRTWLAGKISEFEDGGLDVFMVYAKACKLIMSHAATLGVPPGDEIKATAVMPVVSSPDGARWSVEWSGGGSKGSLLPLGGGRPPYTDKPTGDKINRNVNDCDFCPANACQSRKAPDGAAACISRWNSKFPLRVLTAGKRVVVTGLRSYHEKHKDATSLKGVELKVRPAGDGEKAGRTDRKSSGAITAIVSLKDMCADCDDGETPEDFEQWVDELDEDATCLMVIGDVDELSGDVVIEASVGGGTPSTTAADSIHVASPAPTVLTPVATLESARDVLIARDEEVRALREEVQDTRAMMVRLEEELRLARSLIQSPVTPSTAGTVIMPGTGSRSRAEGASITPTADDPALLTPDQHVAAAAAAAAAAVAGAVGGAIGAVSLPRQGGVEAGTGIGSPDLLMPLSSQYTAGTNTDRRSATLTEALATAIVSESKREPKKTQSALARVSSIANDNFKSIVSYAYKHTSKLDSKQWASLIVVVQAVKPWAQPMLTTLWSAFVQHLKSSFKESLAKGMNNVAFLLLDVVSKLRQVVARKPPPQGQSAVIGTETASLGKVWQDTDDGPKQSSIQNEIDCKPQKLLYMLGPHSVEHVGRHMHGQRARDHAASVIQNRFRQMLYDRNSSFLPWCHCARHKGIGCLMSSRAYGGEVQTNLTCGLCRESYGQYTADVDHGYCNCPCEGCNPVMCLGVTDTGPTFHGTPGSTLFMLGGSSSTDVSGDKRAAPDGLEGRIEEALEIVTNAWIALEDSDSIEANKSQLTQLAHLVGIERVEASTLPALTAAMWPLMNTQLYPRLADAIEKINDGKHTSATRAHHTKIKRVITKLGGVVAVCQAALNKRAATSLELLGEATEASSRVTVVIGVTGDPIKPVVVRLCLPIRGMLAANSSTISLIAVKPSFTDDIMDTIDDLLSTGCDECATMRLLGDCDVPQHCTQCSQLVLALDDSFAKDCMPELGDAAESVDEVGIQLAMALSLTEAETRDVSLTRAQRYEEDCTICDLCELPDSPWQMLCICNVPDYSDTHAGYDSEDELNAFFQQQERSRTPSPTDVTARVLSRSDVVIDAADHLLMLLPGTLMPMSHEDQWEYPPGTLSIDSGCVPALCDNGASLKTSCSKTLDGALLDTYSGDDAGEVGVGNESSSLECRGSYIYVYERFGSDGSGELVVRRMRHTPNLPVRVVFSEPTEVYEHGYRFNFTHEEGRIMTTRSGSKIPLYIGKSTKLGWLKARPVTDKDKAHAAVARAGATLLPIGDGSARSVGMPTVPLTGVAFLRRKHVVYGHCGLRKLLSSLKAEGIGPGVFAKEDIKTFITEGCGSCETAKMKRRAFTLQSVHDKTIAPAGKRWIWDAVKFDGESVEHGYIGAFLATCEATNKHFITGLVGETAEDYKRCHEELRIFNRPHHGDATMVKGDSHPSHRAKDFRDFMTGRPLDGNGMDMQLGPPRVHENVGKAEVAFLLVIPTANAMLMDAPDLGRGHIYSAMRTAVAVWDYTCSNIDANGVSTSANMRYYGKTEWMPNPYYVYGSACKALIHPEERGSKQGPHARPGVYTGPAMNSHSPIHCSVWCDRYLDVDVGCVNIDERVVLARTLRNHPSHQPYNQEGDVAPIEVDTSTWYDPGVNVHPLDAKLAVTTGDDLGDVLPSHTGFVWVSTMVIGVDQWFSLGICSGKARPGDIAGWTHKISDGAHVHIRIDLKAGGYEHRIDRPHVLDGLVALARHSRNICTFLQLPCGPWSVAKFIDDGGPSPLFNMEFPDGMLDSNGAPFDKACSAMLVVNSGVAIGRATLEANNALVSEHPVWQGKGSLLGTRGVEGHSTMHMTTPFVQLIEDFSLRSVVTDFGMSGHSHRTTRELLVSECLHAQFQSVFGVLKVPDGWKSTAEPLRGKDSTGTYRTKHEEVYHPLACERFARCIETYGKALRLNIAVVEGGESATTQSIHTKTPSTSENTIAKEHMTANQIELNRQGSDLNNTGFLVGDRVEVYWTKERKWFKGTVLDNTGYHRHATKQGKKLSSSELYIQYDDGKLHTHSLHNNEIRHPFVAPSLNMLIMDRGNESFKEDFMQCLAEDTDLDTKESVYALFDVDIDLETGEALNKASIFVVDGNGTLLHASRINSMDTLNARYWHEPKNEREYDRSPQRDLWRTAKELKWDEYLNLNMFEWVALSQVDRKTHTIYNTLWAYKIKLNSDTTFKKLNPRWCLKGGTMDRDVFKAHAETIRMSSFRIIQAVKAGYWDALCAILVDCSNAFQATRTDGEFDGTSPTIYCWPASGFEKKTPQGERMVCKLNVGMQGRIDATRMFNSRLFALLLVKAGMARSLWDRQVIIYHNGPLANSDKSLSEILRSIKGAKDTEGQESPIGFAILGWHVDDSLGLACDVNWCLDYKENRVVRFIIGTIEVIYATTCTGWHGNKALGFTLTLDDTRKTVTMSAPDAVSQLAKDILDGSVMVSPKHAMTQEFNDIEAGVVPDVGDPTRDSVLRDMSLCRHGLGVSIWLANAYIAIMRGTNALCRNMAYPHGRTLKCLRFQTMFLVKHGRGVTYGGFGAFGLERDESIPVTSPLAGPKLMFLHFFSDASLDVHSVSGGVAMLAGGCVLPISQTQHLKSPCSHTSETVAAGTNLNILIPIAGLLQEFHILCGASVPFYLDSETTVKVGNSDTAIKKSVWLIRRAAVLEDGVVHKIIDLHHISERDMVADPLTKYLTHAVWYRHMHYLLNYEGPLPPYPSRG